MTEMEITQEMQNVAREASEYSYAEPKASDLPQSNAHRKSIQDAFRYMRAGRTIVVERTEMPVPQIRKAVVPKTIIAKPIEDRISWIDAGKLRKALRTRAEGDSILSLRGSEITKVAKEECQSALKTGKLDIAEWIQNTYQLDNFGFKNKDELIRACRDLYFYTMVTDVRGAPHVSDFFDRNDCHHIHNI